ncbi:hypothetical protein [Reinekea blandensis]|uniref:AsmA domain-containing protein n=1 Tax=Reinekea blandensis MED297 TaxID=314283 RepID=A4BBE9_9GAMM|nr:hypothetical protein [Reinekea blandensis]EAR10762.1 hypothetical protein MED297_12120 [Reinekea sp. MED297] [Reinekea blandensis MED297]
MNTPLIRRSLFIIISVLIVLALIAAVNLWRFDASEWLSKTLPVGAPALQQSDVEVQALGTELTFVEPDIQWSEARFSADLLSLRFNLLSVLLGQPRLQWIGLDAPVLEMATNQIDVQQLHWPIDVGFQELTLTNGLLLLSDSEVTDLELSLLKNGVFGEYAVQASAALYTPDWQATLGLSTLLGRDGDENLVLGKTQLDTNLVMLNWTGRLAGKLKSVRITPDNDLQLSYLSWSSNWRTSKELMPYILDWAGGLTEGTLSDGRWTLDTLDSALAYRDSNDTAHTLAIQSNASTWQQGDLVGQLGLSLLAEYPLDSPYQSYQLVMSGQLNENEPLSLWHNPVIRLSTVRDDGLQQTHQVQAARLKLDTQVMSWQLHDGDWTLNEGESILDDFGFGQVSGQWPALTPDQSHRMANALSPALTLISQDTEKLDALFSHLVP